MRTLAPLVAVLFAACDQSGRVEVVEVDVPVARPDNPPGFDAGPPVMDAGGFTIDVPPLDRPVRDVQPNPDAFFANHPPPCHCAPDGGADGGPPGLRGRTPEGPRGRRRFPL